jgi:hypothetical protein
VADDVEALGRRVARRLIVGDIRPGPGELAEQWGVAIVHREAPPPAQPRLRSEYVAEPARITLYTDTIDALGAAIRASQRFDMMRCSLAELHIAHELFHHLEFGERFGNLTPDEVEAAAHAFARELLELDFHPAELSELSDSDVEHGCSAW